MKHKKCHSGAMREAQPTALSSRESEILDLLLADFTSKQIAAKLEISRKTLEFHIANIRQKYGARTPYGLAAAALKQKPWAGNDTIKTRQAADKEALILLVHELCHRLGKEVKELEAVPARIKKLKTTGG